ncbi:MAG: class II aldolase/adducin family protein [Rhodospirillales bacterium]|nr:class II aldolase/adducin family protein [Rhodospirillales bacterium]
MSLQDICQQVWEANVTLPKAGLVKWAQGNASGRDPETGLIAIKPSGVRLDQLTVDQIVVVDPDGKIVQGDMKPSIDTASHLYVYSHRDDVNGIVHTHSPYATAFAVRGEALDVYSTTAAALFGGAIPISEFATIGEEEIGREIVERIGGSSAILLRSHGVFTIGKTPYEALKYSIYVEEEAEIVHLARFGNTPLKPLAQPFVDEARRMYLEDYGQ